MRNTLKYRLRLATGSLALAAALCGGNAVAQDTADETPAVDLVDRGDAIIVTGTRIQSQSFDSTAPVQVITSESIEATNAINIQESLLLNPVFGTPTISRTNSSFATSTTGIATIDLRNLGNDRTLVLVDGRRFVSGVPGSAAVDLNAIPTALIERVDILTSGSGSAIYGSDAVAGVVNFVLKDDFEGVQVDASTGITEVGDSEEYTLGVTMGSNFADGRGNAVIYAGYTKEGAAFLRDHKTEAGPSENDSLSELYFGGAFNEPREPFFSSYSPFGTYFTDDYSFTYAPTGTLQPCTTTNGTSCSSDLGTGTGPTGFNRTAFRYLAAPVERYLLSLNANYELSDMVDVFVQGSYSSTSANSNIEPFPFATDDAYSDGQMPIENYYTDPETLVTSIIRNPFVPDAIYDNATDASIYDTDGDGEADTGDGLRDIYITKRLTDFGPRQTSADRETFRIVTGLRGDLSPSWNYEAFFNYGKTSQTQLGSGQINTPNLREALNIIPDGEGGFTCANPEAVNQGCVAANFFGQNSLSPEALEYLAAPTTFNAEVSQMQAGLFVGGELFSLMQDVDPILVSAGVEYRKEKSSDIWDVLSQRGLNAGNALPPTSGSFDVKEVYGEVQVPLVQDSFFESVLVRGAVRYSDYSTVGGTFSWNAGGEIAPIRDIRFRAMYAETVRAPNINELYSGYSQTFPTLTDPCQGVTQDGSALATNCFADVGVQNNAAANAGVFTLNGTSDLQGVTGFEGGNPALEEETGKTFTAGVVINPVSIDALRNLSLEIDYYNVKIAGAIVSTPRQYILDQCYQEGNSDLCDFVIRRPASQGPYSAGSLDEVNTGGSNSGGVKAEGIDVKVNYRHDLSSLLPDTNVSLSLTYSHLLDSYTIPLPGADKNILIGEVGASKDRFTLQTFFDVSDFRLAFTGTYVGPAYLDDQLTGSGPDADDYQDYRFHDEFYVDIQARYTFLDRHELFIGVSNLFDNDPIYAGGLLTTGMEADTGTYDPLGRRYYAGVKFRL